MSDLIRREDAAYKVEVMLTLFRMSKDIRDDAIDLFINSIPAVKLKVGKWIEEYNGNGWNDYWDYTCSNCGKKYERADILYKANYCPNCGAKMERVSNV